MVFMSDLLLLSTAILTTINAKDPNIRLPPTIITGPDKIYLYRDLTTVSLPCEAIGYPEPTYKWMKNGAELSMVGIVFPDPTIGSIQIGQATKDYEGFYQCFATNDYGVTMSNVSLLRMASHGSYDVNTPKVNITVAPNDKLRVNCNAPDSIPSALYSWSYNTTTTLGQSDVALSRRVQIDFDGNLCFASVSSSETSNRLFRCNVHNYVMSTTQSGAYSRIDVSGTAVNNVAPSLFFSSPSTVVALQSQQTTLRCFFSGTDQNGQGLITYTWNYNGGNVLPPGWTIRDGDVSSPASGTDPSAAGIYICYGRNTLGQASTTIELIVEAIPDLGSPDNENQPHDMNVTEGDTITINCQPNAVPDATIQWFKNTEVFDTNNLPPKFELSNDLMTLTISDICKDCADGTTDLMNIECNTSNSHGYGFAQGYVNVLLATQITSKPVSVRWSPNANYLFDCQATCDISTPCHPPQWTFDGEPVQEDGGRLFIHDNGTLHIETANDIDAGSSRIGSYACNVSNGYSSKTMKATILGPIADSAPQLQFSTPSPVIALRSQQTTLQCIFSGSDNNGQGSIIYSWMYNGQNGLPPGWIYSDGVASSPLSGTDPSAAGTYTCIGRNTLGQASATLTLIVHQIPDFGSDPNNQPHDMNVTEGATVRIRCMSNADPPASIKWSVSKTIFERSNLPPKFSFGSDLTTLTIYNVCKDCADGSSDSMNIECNASNIYGYAFAHGYLNVLLATQITSKPVSVQWYPNANYLFDCQATCDISTPCHPPQWTFNGKPVQEDGYRLFVYDNGSLHIETANDMDNGRSRIGTYTCTISNGYSSETMDATIARHETSDAAGQPKLWWMGLLVAFLTKCANRNV